MLKLSFPFFSISLSTPGERMRHCFGGPTLTHAWYMFFRLSFSLTLRRVEPTSFHRQFWKKPGFRRAAAANLRCLEERPLIEGIDRAAKSAFPSGHIRGALMPNNTRWLAADWLIQKLFRLVHTRFPCCWLTGWPLGPPAVAGSEQRTRCDLFFLPFFGWLRVLKLSQLDPQLPRELNELSLKTSLM